MDECKPLPEGEPALLPQAQRQLGPHGVGAAPPLGRAVQVEPGKPTLKPPGSKRLKLQSEALLSSVAFKFNLCRYNWGFERFCIGKFRQGIVPGLTVKI